MLLAIGDFLESIAYDINAAGGNIGERLTEKIYPFHEVVIDTPATFTPTTTATQLLTGQGYKWVFSFILRVRSMGTATYIRLGTFQQQNYTLIAVGQTIEFSGNAGEVVDLSKFFVKSDTSDAVLEIIAAYVPLHLVGIVEQSVGRNY
jgi:hypothetical protein